MKLLPIVLALVLPMTAQADCSKRDLRGRWTTIAAADRVVTGGGWQHCNVYITAAGRATGRCVNQENSTEDADPIQFTVFRDCAFQAVSETGNFSYSGKIQRGKRGAVGTFFYNDGIDFLHGPFVAVKR